MGGALPVAYRSISPPPRLGLADKKPSLLLRVDSSTRSETPTASEVTSQVSAPPSPLLPHYSPLRSQLVFLWGQTSVGPMNLPRGEICAASTSLPT